jgi:hypothetical protein
MRFQRVVTLLALAALALGGWAGGLALVTDRSGGRLHLTADELPSWLRLDDYLVPGILLIVLFGLLPVVAVVLLFRRSSRGWSLTVAVGLLLILWTLGQLVVLGLTFVPVQAGMLGLGIVLTGLGVDGGTQARVVDESRSGVKSYEHDQS